GFVMEDRPVILDSVLVEAVVEDADARKALDGLPLAERATVAVGRPDDGTAPTWPSSVRMFVSGDVRDVALHRREKLAPGQVLEGPAIIAEAAGTNIIEPGWRACVTERGDLLLRRIGDGGPAGDRSDDGRPVNGTAGDLGPRAPRGVPGSDRSEPDPALLEVFHGLFMSIAEQMGEVLRNTAHSVNIKERLDFSCALFDGEGRLVANAPHIPVHLGSMGECVRALIADRGPLRRGEVWAVNSPFRGGTHLPDITVVTPVYLDTEYGQAGDVLLFHVASRGHHADVGGIAPGSMPPDSRTIEEEGVLTDGLRIVGEGRFLEDAVLSWLVSGPYPCRDPRQNLADLQAQAAANGRGVREIQRMVETHGLATVEAYMGHVRENAAEAVRRVIDRLRDGSAEVHMDGGSVIRVRIDVDAAERRVLVDLTGTSDQRDDNFNAPMAVTQAAVLYALRTLVADEIPLNDGCLEPVDIVVPGGTLLNPRPPAAVAAGNVETSQHVVDAILAAAGAQAGSQGTMNNLTFGTVEWQYYETICGGTGAGPGFDGADAVHSHMTNTRITDPEVIERRFPVRVEEFSIRRGSGGDGRHRGGDGAVRRIRFLEGATVAILSSRRTIPPRGLAGGLAGAPGRNRLVRAGGAA
ncbi:MAG TPA: 5-oxoprolinase, partial [Thermoplasmata archaeon]|nr:5-oxoprolinase [Thermoplasmata archaeon]